MLRRKKLIAGLASMAVVLTMGLTSGAPTAQAAPNCPVVDWQGFLLAMLNPACTTVQLQNSITETYLNTVLTTGSKTLDLQGYTLDLGTWATPGLPGNEIVVISGADLTVIGQPAGMITGAPYLFNLSNGNSLTLQSGTFDAPDTVVHVQQGLPCTPSAPGDCARLDIGRDATLNSAVGIDIISGNTTPAPWSWGTADGVLINVSGKINATDHAILLESIVRPTSDPKTSGEVAPVININDGAVLIGGVAALGYGVWNVTGGQITGIAETGSGNGRSAFEIASGVLNLTGGTLTGVGPVGMASAPGPDSIATWSYGTSTWGYGLAVVQSEVYPGYIDVEVPVMPHISDAASPMVTIAMFDYVAGGGCSSSASIYSKPTGVGTYSYAYPEYCPKIYVEPTQITVTGVYHTSDHISGGVVDGTHPSIWVYPVKFDSNGGVDAALPAGPPVTQYVFSSIGDDNTVGYQNRAAKPAAIHNPTMTGQVFTGWYTAPVGGRLWNFNDPVTGADVDGNHTMILYAHWAHGVIFDINGGQYCAGAGCNWHAAMVLLTGIDDGSGVPAGSIPPDPVWPDGSMRFIGWTLDPNCQGRACVLTDPTASIVTTDNLVFYAVWVPTHAAPQHTNCDKTTCRPSETPSGSSSRVVPTTPSTPQFETPTVVPTGTSTIVATGGRVTGSPWAGAVGALAPLLLAGAALVVRRRIPVRQR